MSELGERARIVIRKALLDNGNVHYQAFIDISDNSYMELNEEFETLRDFIETLGEISYGMTILFEVSIKCRGRDKLKQWMDIVSYWKMECEAELY